MINNFRIYIYPSMFIFLSMQMGFANDASKSDPLEVTISGQTHERVPLESLQPTMQIPSLETLSFSLDGGKEAIEGEVVPVSILDAALKSDPTEFPISRLPVIPSGPFLIQPLTDKSLQNVSQWSLTVINEKGTVVTRIDRNGPPPSTITWNGYDEDLFSLDPNRTYSSFITLISTQSNSSRIPGEGARFFCFSHKTDTDEVIEFGHRLYNSNSPFFSQESNIFLDDLIKRLTLHIRHNGKWMVELREPENTEFAQAVNRHKRKNTWLTYLSQKLGQNIDPEKIILTDSPNGESKAKITLYQFHEPDRPSMMGMVHQPRPLLESTKDWITWKENERAVIVEMRHDRLFRPGTAYLRDEAIEPLTKALLRIQQEAKQDPASSEIKNALEQGAKAKKQFDKSAAYGKPIVLRSFMSNTRDKKKGKNQEDDPKLAALRTKVLFMLFAEARYSKS